MAVSSLATVRVPADPSNYTNGRSGRKIEAVTIHHMAGVLSAEQCGNIFARAGRNGSTHYGIGNDGRIGSYVDEDNTAWGNSNWDSNCKSVSIETSNSATGGDWPVGNAAYESLIKLVADIAKRNGLGELIAGKNLTWHSMFANTTCPGNFLRARIDEIAKRANEINNGAPAPAPAPEENIYDPSRYTDEQLADLVIRGVYGNGNARKQALGDRYSKVQEIVNARCGVAPAGSTVQEIKVGDKVVPIKLVSYEGIPLVKYDDYYIVSQINGKRAVLTARGAVWAAVHTDNLQVVN